MGEVYGHSLLEISSMEASPSLEGAESKSCARNASRERKTGIPVNIAVLPDRRYVRRESKVKEIKPPQAKQGEEFLVDHLTSLNIEDKLRLLALKEMQAFEIKDKISVWSSKLDKTERELQNMRVIIQNHYKDLSMLNQRRRRPDHKHKPKETSIQEKRLSQLESDMIPQTNLWTNLSKPLNFIQNIDNMIQSEFEKSLNPQHGISEVSEPKYEKNGNRDARAKPRAISGDLREHRKGRDYPRKESHEKEYEVTSRDEALSVEDMINSVSNSIWGFMNDMKSNVLSTVSDEESPPRRDDEREKQMKNKDIAHKKLD